MLGFSAPVLMRTEVVTRPSRRPPGVLCPLNASGRFHFLGNVAVGRDDRGPHRRPPRPCSVRPTAGGIIGDRLHRERFGRRRRPRHSRPASGRAARQPRAVDQVAGDHRGRLAMAWTLIDHDVLGRSPGVLRGKESELLSPTVPYGHPSRIGQEVPFERWGPPAFCSAGVAFRHIILRFRKSCQFARVR